MATSTEFWVDGVGINNLSGIPQDPDNPAILTDAAILDFLTRIPEARNSFNRLVPTMSDEEQERLNNIARMANNGMVIGEIETGDRFQHGWNTRGVRRGGGWRPSSG